MLAHDSNNPARSYSTENFKYPFFIKLLYVTNIKMNIKVVWCSGPQDPKCFIVFNQYNKYRMRAIMTH